MIFFSFAVVTLFLSLFLIEVALRIYGGAKGELKNDIYRISFCCGYKLKANSLSSYDIDPDGFRRTLLGFDGRPENEVFKIVAMGDSITFGATNTKLFSYPSYLELVLNSDRGRVELPKGKKYVDVINAGIIGYSSFQLKKYLRDTVLDLKPDMVIVSIGTHDQSHVLNNPFLWFLEDNIPLFYWYYNHSATTAYLRRVFSPIIAGRKEKSLGELKSGTKSPSEDDLKNPDAYGTYENNVREIVRMLKERNVLPVLVPWPLTEGKGDIKDFAFDEVETVDPRSKTQYRMMAGIMEKIAREYSIPIVYTPFQEPIVSPKHSVKYFMASRVHLNDSGGEIMGFVLANAIKEILKGKNNQEVYSKSYASIPDLDLFDLYFEIINNEEKGRFGEMFYAAKSIAADYCMKYTRDDLTVPDHSFSDCFFSLPDTALSLMNNPDSLHKAKKYLDHSIGRYPKLAYPYFIYGLYYLKSNDPGRAKEFFKKAAELAPFFKEPRKYLSAPESP